MWLRIGAWLNRIPIGDPVDRSNAVFVQLLLIFEGLRLPLNKCYLLLNGHYHYPFPAAAVDLGTDLAMTLAAWSGLWLIRRGRLRGAVWLYLGTLFISAVIAYASLGFKASPRDMVPLLILTLGGLILGRRALWACYAMVCAIFAAGMTADGLAAAASGRPSFAQLLGAYSNLPSMAGNYLPIVIIIDRSIGALRRALAESNARGLRLQHEMAERERAQEALIHAQKMEAIGQLSGGVAHDFNNILGVILGFASERHRLDDLPGSPRQHAKALADALEGVETAARRGSAISRKLLNFSRRDYTRAETFDAAQALRELQPMLRQLLPAEIVLELETAAHALPIRIDRSQFDLAVLNIAGNARDAMPQGGRFRVSAGIGTAGTVEIALDDDGNGIEDAVRRHIFEPFFTTKPAGRGTGLGLAVVYGLIQRAGGSIKVESAPDRGARFQLSLPLVAQLAEPTPVGMLEQRLRVLLVDDDDALRNLLADALETGGCTVLSAACGAEAERLVREQAPPDVLVCDNRMPDTDGAGLLRRLREQLRDVPAILISAYLESDSQPPGAVDGLVERLPKPFAPDLLLQRVQQLAARRRPLAIGAEAAA